MVNAWSAIDQPPLKQSIHLVLFYVCRVLGGESPTRSGQMLHKLITVNMFFQRRCRLLMLP